MKTKTTTIVLEEELLEKAKSMGINLSSFVREALKNKINESDTEKLTSTISGLKKRINETEEIINNIREIKNKRG